MGLCCSKKSLYLCRMKNIEDVNRFRVLCEVYEVEMKSIEGDHITIEANEQQIDTLKKFCSSVYNISEPGFENYLKMV